MALGAAGGARGAWLFSQTICLVYYSQDIETVLANMTESYFSHIWLANFCFKCTLHLEHFQLFTLPSVSPFLWHYIFSTLELPLLHFFGTSAAPFRNVAVWNRPIAWPLALVLAAFSITAHPINFTLDTALPWVLSKKVKKTDLAKIQNGGQLI